LVIRNYILFVIAAVYLLILTGCNQNSAGDWNANFVVWKGNNYIVTEHKLDNITEEIGEVNSYSENEVGLIDRNVTFSNYFKEGTKLYKIKGIDVNNSIAAKINKNKIIELKCNGKYGK
jgi:hypothetical protein